jgi:hypothetical protein
MANVYDNQDDRGTTVELGSYNSADEASRNISRATWVMIAVAVLFLIIAAVLMGIYFTYPAV